MHTDRLNVIFIFLSIFIAILLPFELFLFSYAVLGPMHYLTEINWLKSKKYFSRSSFSTYVLGGIVCLISFIYLVDYFNLTVLEFKLSAYTRLIVTILILSGFIQIILVEYFYSKISTAFSVIFSFIISIALLKLHKGFHHFSLIFLPTVIHVYVFTGLFIIYGYIKSNKKIALWSIILLLFAPILLYILPSEFFGLLSPHNAKVSYYNSNFMELNKLLSIPFSSQTSRIELKIQSFIAFAYTYHYLNWFGKTNVIGWSKSINKKKSYHYYFLLVIDSRHLCI